MSRRFKVHPAIGIARLGNAPEAFFIGPERPGVPANWDDVAGSFQSFRDEAGRIKRQAARFHVFEYTEDAQGRLSSPKEVVVGGDITDIEWRVHVANKKGSFFTFDAQEGASDGYDSRSTKKQPTDYQKGDKDNPDNPENPLLTNRRNSAFPGDPRLLEIDPGEQLIAQKASPKPVLLSNSNKNIPFIKDLGELRLDEGGRLLFLGGHGVSGSTETPPRKINEYANNDTWFDDVSDGPVKARVRLSDGTAVDADAAWVTVAPPDFAPGIGNVVTLYDTLWDIAVRELPLPGDNATFSDGALHKLSEQKQAWKAGKETSLAKYSPSFTQEICPILARAFGARDVFRPGDLKEHYHHELDPEVYDVLASPAENPDDEGSRARQEIFKKWIRNPSFDKPDWTRMPRGHGDRYDLLDDEHPDDAAATSFLSLTKIQYALLEQWAAGNFVSPSAAPGIPKPNGLTPEGLDQAALENCVGGPFYPGIEVSWLIRRPELYVEPFRFVPPPRKIGALQFGPGFFSQQMALPWQADFYDCHKEKHTLPDNGEETYFMWWTAQRPDDVFPAGASEQVRWVRDFDEGKTPDEADDLNNLERFKQMQKNWHQLRFIILNKAKERFEEEEFKGTAGA